MSIHLTLVFLVLTAQTAVAQELPSIHLLYQSPDGSIFDRNCAQITKTAINPRQVQETVRRLAEFQSWWDKDGPQYLSVVLKEIELPFPYRAMQMTLSVCPGVTGAMAEPLMMNVQPFLSDAAVARPNWNFSTVVFHKLMHQYVRPVLESSQLRRKYASEPPAVQLHLHVLALVRFALVKLGKDAELKWMDAEARGVNRAWEIVSDIEGYEPFLNELKALPKSAVTPN